MLEGWLLINEFLHTNKFYEIYSWLLKAAQRQGIGLKLTTNSEVMIVLESEKTNTLFLQKKNQILYYFGIRIFL